MSQNIPPRPGPSQLVPTTERQVLKQVCLLRIIQQPLRDLIALDLLRVPMM